MSKTMQFDFDGKFLIINKAFGISEISKPINM
jgi:hypothetical protein